jgi:two-component system chemotaxis response regulator CheY
MAIDMTMPVLVVDDYNTMIRIIRNLLKQLGFEDVDDASDGSAALAKMRDKKYGLVISDWNMEPMTGYELLKEVRADPGLNKTPFIMVTGFRRARHRSRITKMRADSLWWGRPASCGISAGATP